MAKKSRGNAYGTYSAFPHRECDTLSSVPVIVYQHTSEFSPLLPGETKRTCGSVSSLLQILGCGLALCAFVFMAHNTYTHFMRCPPGPAERDAIRLLWENEKAQHDFQQREWQLKQRKQDETERGWKRDAEEHEREVVRERERWKQELEERERHEEEERQKLHMFWGSVEAHTCTTYATREYTARLMNLPTSWQHPLDACKATPLEIHGILHLPMTCEERGLGVMIGRWEINQNEPDCTPYWDSYNDKGCTSPGSGRKYVTHKLENLPEKNNWQEFCASTPAHFDHMQFPGAQVCIDSIWGVYGQWELDDSNC